jgi:hypothetical protein
VLLKIISSSENMNFTSELRLYFGTFRLRPGLVWHAG